MIIIGNIGLGGLSKVKALGSISRGVAEKTMCPILNVHIPISWLYWIYNQFKGAS